MGPGNSTAYSLMKSLAFGSAARAVRSACSTYSGPMKRRQTVGGERAVVGHRLVDDVPLGDVARVVAHHRADVVLHDLHQLVAPPAGQQRRRVADEPCRAGWAGAAGRSAAAACRPGPARRGRRSTAAAPGPRRACARAPPCRCGGRSRRARRPRRSRTAPRRGCSACIFISFSGVSESNSRRNVVAVAPATAQRPQAHGAAERHGTQRRPSAGSARALRRQPICASTRTASAASTADPASDPPRPPSERATLAGSALLVVPVLLVGLLFLPLPPSPSLACASRSSCRTVPALVGDTLSRSSQNLDRSGRVAEPIERDAEVVERVGDS